MRVAKSDRFWEDWSGFKERFAAAVVYSILDIADMTVDVQQFTVAAVREEY